MKHTPFSNKYFVIALVPLALILIAVGLFLVIDYEHFRSNAVITSGRIEKAYFSDGEDYDTCSVLVEYSVGEKKYHLYIHHYDKGRNLKAYGYEGRPVTVMYDKNHPAESRTMKEPYRKSMLLVGVGVVSLLLSFVLHRRNNHYDKVIRNGIILDAVVTEIIEAYEGDTGVFSYIIDKLFSHGMSPGVNHGKSGKILCEWCNPVSGQVHKFSSLAKDNALPNYIGKSVKVYVDPNDYSKYYVDVDSVINQPFK
ncbi:MAG: hypothetical protein IKK42_03220 [Oscillospiraceae bacterium]|nr:hypothetical protein [Oscillospiraceae bacterium]